MVERIAEQYRHRARLLLDRDSHVGAEALVQFRRARVVRVALDLDLRDLGVGTQEVTGFLEDRGFALAEMRAVMSTVFERVELEPAAARPERIVRRAFTLSPRDGARVVVNRRLG